MKTLLLGLLLQAGENEVEDTVEKDNDQDEDIAIVARLVHCHNEAEALHYESKH